MGMRTFYRTDDVLGYGHMALPLRTTGGAGRIGGTGRLGSISAKPGLTGTSKLPGKTDAPSLSKGDKRMAAIKESMQATKSTATSAAHQGVVARPMDKNLSKMLEQRRAQMQSRGTSVARLGKEEDEGSSSVKRLGEDQAQGATSVKRLGEDTGSAPSNHGTSIARLNKKNDEQTPSYLPVPPSSLTPKQAPPPGLSDAPTPIDIFGDL